MNLDRFNPADAEPPEEEERKQTYLVLVEVALEIDVQVSGTDDDDMRDEAMELGVIRAKNFMANAMALVKPCELEDWDISDWYAERIE